MGVKYLKITDGKCTDCYFHDPVDNSIGDCLIMEMKCSLLRCFKLITPAEFNASTGIKWRVKKDGRVLPYEDDSAEIIIIMDDKK